MRHLKGRTGCFLTIGLIMVMVLIGGGVFWGSHNSLATRSQTIEGQWAQMETQYQWCFDLIPNLVNSVRGIVPFGRSSDSVYG